jgi:hypothetical protein
MDEPAFIHIDSAGGKRIDYVPVRVIGRSGKTHYRCRLERAARLPTKAWGLKGEIITVPVYAVHFAYPKPEQMSLLSKMADKYYPNKKDDDDG